MHCHNQETPGEPSISEQRQREGCRGSYSKNDTEKSIFGTAMERDGEQLMEPWKKREAGEKEKVEGWMEGRGAMKGSCSTCDGWALAQVWRRDQIKSLSRQQWTRDKVITFAPSFPLSPPSPLCLPPSAWLSVVCPHLSSPPVACRSTRRAGLRFKVLLDTFQSCTLGVCFMPSLTFICWLDGYGCLWETIILSNTKNLKYKSCFKSCCRSIKVYYRVQNMFTPLLEYIFLWIGSNIPIMGKCYNTQHEDI